MPRRSSDRSISMAHARHPDHSHHPPMCPRPRESPRARARGGTTHGGAPPAHTGGHVDACRVWLCFRALLGHSAPRLSRPRARTDLPTLSLLSGWQRCAAPAARSCARRARARRPPVRARPRLQRVACVSAREGKPRCARAECRGTGRAVCAGTSALFGCLQLQRWGQAVRERRRRPEAHLSPCRTAAASCKSMHRRSAAKCGAPGAAALPRDGVIGTVLVLGGGVGRRGAAWDLARRPGRGVRCKTGHELSEQAGPRRQ